MAYLNQYFIKKGSLYTVLVLFIASFFSCREGEDEKYNQEKKDPTLTTAYEEYDTLALKTFPENISEWISYYGQFDKGFELVNFKASGVVLHLDSLNNASGQTDESIFKSISSYSPDSSMLIDFWSYLRNIETDDQGNKVLTGGGPDQEVIIADKKKNLYKQLMYNGTQQVVETADWVNDNSFILGLINSNETGLVWIPEIYLFNLSDSTFTNFRLNHDIQVDSLVLKNADFSRHWLNRKQIRLE